MISSEIWLNIVETSPVPMAVYRVFEKRFPLVFSNKAYQELFAVTGAGLKSASGIFSFSSVTANQDFVSVFDKSLQKVFKSGLTERINNLELSIHYPDKAVPERINIDIENTPFVEAGSVKYVCQTIIRHEISAMTVLPDAPGSEPRSRAELMIDSGEANDATERHNAEYQLKASKKIFRTLVENGADVVVILDSAGKRQYVSPSIKSVLGFTEEEAMALSLNDRLHPADQASVAERLLQALQRPGEPIEGHIARVKHKDGSWRWIEATFTNMMNDPMINGIVSNFRDVTKRQEAELERNLLINNTEESFVLLNKDLIIVSFNDQFYRLYKNYFNKEVRKGEFILDYAPPERRTVLLGIYSKVLQGGLDSTIIHVKDPIFKEELIYAVKYKPAKNSEGEIIGVFVTALDVTDRENALRRLEGNEAKLLAAQKIAKVGYWQSFPDQKGLYWSNEVYNIWGRDRKTFQLNYESYYDTIHPDDREEFLKSREKAFTEGVQHDIEHRIILPDGTIKWVHALGNLVRNERGDIIIFEGTVQDTTTDRLAFEKLLISEARHRGIVESQTNYMIRMDLEGNYSFCNNKFLEDFGWLYQGKDVIGENIMSSILEYHHERVATTVGKCFGELNKVFQVFIDKPKKDGNGVVSTVWDFICLTDSKGQPSEIQCVGIDVSEWKQAQEELETSNARYEYVTRATSDAIWDWDLRTDEVYRGGGFQALFGYSGDTTENLGDFWEEHIHPDDLEGVLHNIETVLNGNLETWNLDYRFKKSDGKYTFVHDKGIVIRDDKGTPVKMVGAMQDISDSKIAEKQKFLHSEISRLFNQPDVLLNEILGEVLRHILDYGDIAIAEIWMSGSDKRYLNLTASCTKDNQFDSFYAETANFKSFARGEGIPGRVWESGKFERWDDIDTDSKFPRHEAAKNANLKFVIGFPLVYNEEFIGVLALGHQAKGENLMEHAAFRDEFRSHLSSEIKRKQLDQELKQIFSFAPDIITVVGTDGYFKKINPAACEMLGYSEEELLAVPVKNFVHPDDKDITGQLIKSRGNRTNAFYFENRYITKSGKVLWLGWTSTPSPEEGLIFAVAKDITEKKKLEDLLEKSNSLAEIGSWEVDVLNSSLYWSSVTKEIHEVDVSFEPDIETGINFYKEGASRNSIKRAFERSLIDGAAWDMELSIITGKGNLRWVRVIGETEFIKGKCVKLYGSFQNITNRKVAELELLKLYEEKNAILESIQDGFFAVDKNNTVIYWNHEAENLLFLKRSEVLNKSIKEVFKVPVESKFYSEYQRAVETNEPVRFEEYFQILNKWFEVSAFPTEDGLTVYFRDVTGRKKLELELLQFKEIIDNSRDGITIVDLDGKITYLNPSFASAIGFDPIIHDHPESVYANRQLVGQVFDTLLSGKYWQGDVEIKGVAGELISYYLSAGPVFDEQGKLMAVYGIHTDITERKQAEQQIRKAFCERNTILESIRDGFFAVGKDWKVNYWNKEAETLLGKTRKQTLGKNLWKVFANMTDSSSYLKYQEAIDTNQVVHFEDHYPVMNKWYEVSAYPSVDGLSVFFKDITERKINDILFKDLNGVLHKKVKELAISNSELEQFAYVASHDLQEPLRMISSFLTLLQRKYNDQLDPKAHQYINFAVDGATRMRQIILDLLDFSRVGRVEDITELVDLNEVINEILVLYRKKIDETKALFVISDMPSINVPKAGIRQLLQNLISNALKYQSTDNTPLVEIGFSDMHEHWEFWVKDNGIGISPDYFEKVFIIFQRLHTKENYSGTGMGLAICRKIVDTLGGKLWIDSVLGEGSTFYFTIPKAIPSE